MPNLSLKIFNYLKFKEGVKNVAYTLPGEGYPTVGIGHHAKDLIAGKFYTDAQICQFFRQDHNYIKSNVLKYWHPPMTQQMFDALYLIAYGHGSVPPSLGKLVSNNFGNKSAVAALWANTAINKKYAAAHRKRRQEEIAIFYGPDTGPEMDLNNISLGAGRNIALPTDGSGDFGGIAGGNMFGGMGMGMGTFTFTGPTITTSAPSVLAKSNSNIYSRITASDKKNNIKHTRIYKYSEASIKLDELSLPLNGQNTRIDPSTKQHVKEKDKTVENYSKKDKKENVTTNKKKTISSNKQKDKKYGGPNDNENKDTTSTDTITEDITINNNTETETETFAGTTTTQESKQNTTDIKEYDVEMKESDNPRGYRHSDFKKAAGQSFPIIRINDYYVAASEIMAFEIESIGFIPIARLTIKSANNHLLKNDTIKEGDKMAVFCAPGHGMIKSLRCDFLITQVHHTDIAQNNINQPYTFDITGELYIPNLYNSNMSFAFSGTSRDAIIDAASKAGLGFFFCDDENTDDAQMWYCTTEGGEAAQQMQNAPQSNLMNYIQFVTQHAWKNFDSFYDSWIDPRYGLSFINVNKMLGEKGMDETFDVTIFNSMFNAAKGVDGANIDNTNEEKRKNPTPQIKLINNIPTDNEAGTAYYAESFKEINQAASISREIGVTTTIDYTVDNQVTDPSTNQVSVKFSIPYNKDKYPNGGFYIMIGPGQNESYNQANNGSYVDQSAKVYGGVTTDMQADSDGELITETGSNDMASGNVNKFFDVAYEHNRINNLQLQKKLVKVVLNGANFTVMRGEKIPTLFLDNNKLTTLMGTEKIDPQTDKPAESPKLRQSRLLNACVFTNLSGWFIISGITWRYNAQVTNGMTAWTTELILTRREWPRPGYINVTTSEKDILDINISNGTHVDSKQVGISNPQATKSENDKTTEKDKVEQQDKVQGTVPLTGVKEYLKELYHLIEKQVGTNGVRLVGARRYAADKDNKRVDGNAYIHTLNGYKCIDALGNVMYFESNNSRHLYGEAIDIINGTGVSFDDLLKKHLLINGDILKIMYDNGLSCYIETSVDDTGTTSRHYHIGTDTVKQNSWWAAVQALNGGSNIITTSTTRFNLTNYMINNNKADKEYQLTDTIEIQ